MASILRPFSCGSICSSFAGVLGPVVHMTKLLAFRTTRLVGALLLPWLAACASDRDPPPAQASFYRSMAAAGAQIDAATAASMISGYRRNNGLGEVTVEPALMQLAE